MKTLQESLHDKIVCGKHLFEKLKIKKGSSNKTQTISIPATNPSENIIYKDEEWKEITLPNKEYIIYNDKYRRNKPHLSNIDDFLFNLMQFQDDFEDFNFDNDILYSSDDEQEIAEWYIKDYLKLELPEDDGDTADWVNAQKTNKKIYDNLSFIHDLYLGYDHIDTMILLDITNKETLIDSFNSIVCWDVK